MKYNIAFIFLLVFMIPKKLFSQINAKNVISNSAKNESEIGLGWALNIEHKYSVVSFKYYTPRTIWKDKIRLRFDFEGYRITKFVITEYNRLFIQADYRIDLRRRNNYEHYLLPKAGLSLIFDLYDGSLPAKGLSYASIFGMDYEARTSKFQFQTKNTVSFFSDGLWYELTPGISCKIYKNTYLKASMNMIMAFTYNGKSSIGFFPGISINVFPNGKRRRKE